MINRLKRLKIWVTIGALIALTPIWFLMVVGSERFGNRLERYLDRLEREAQRV